MARKVSAMGVDMGSCSSAKIISDAERSQNQGASIEGVARICQGITKKLQSCNVFLRAAWACERCATSSDHTRGLARASLSIVLHHARSAGLRKRWVITVT
jgi:hypothetical protein